MHNVNENLFSLYEGDDTFAIAFAETGHFRGRSKHLDLRFLVGSLTQSLTCWIKAS